jgi:hypothetical protein
VASMISRRPRRTFGLGMRARPARGVGRDPNELVPMKVVAYNFLYVENCGGMRRAAVW